MASSAESPWSSLVSGSPGAGGVSHRGDRGRDRNRALLLVFVLEHVVFVTRGGHDDEVPVETDVIDVELERAVLLDLALQTVHLGLGCPFVAEQDRDRRLDQVGIIASAERYAGGAAATDFVAGALLLCGGYPALPCSLQSPAQVAVGVVQQGSGASVKDPQHALDGLGVSGDHPTSVLEEGDRPVAPRSLPEFEPPVLVVVVVAVLELVPDVLEVDVALDHEQLPISTRGDDKRRELVCQDSQFLKAVLAQVFNFVPECTGCFFAPHLLEVEDQDMLGVRGDERQDPGQLGASASSRPARLHERGREEQRREEAQGRDIQTGVVPCCPGGHWHRTLWRPSTVWSDRLRVANSRVIDAREPLLLRHACPDRHGPSSPQQVPDALSPAGHLPCRARANAASEPRAQAAHRSERRWSNRAPVVSAGAAAWWSAWP